MQLKKYLTENAEAMENDQRLVVAAMGRFSHVRLKETMYKVDWPTVVSEYSDKTLNRVRSSGTNLQFEPRLAKLMENVVRHEQSLRNASKGTPKGHGMGEDGGQQ